MVTVSPNSEWKQVQEILATKFSLQTAFKVKYKHASASTLVSVLDGSVLTALTSSDQDWKAFLVHQKFHNVELIITLPTGLNLSQSQSYLPLRTIEPEKITFLSHTPISSGNFGEIYQGKHLGTDVAIKKIKDEDGVFRKEIEIAWYVFNWLKF